MHCQTNREWTCRGSPSSTGSRLDLGMRRLVRRPNRRRFEGFAAWWLEKRSGLHRLCVHLQARSVIKSNVKHHQTQVRFVGAVRILFLIGHLDLIGVSSGEDRSTNTCKHIHSKEIGLRFQILSTTLHTQS